MLRGGSSSSSFEAAAFCPTSSTTDNSARSNVNKTHSTSAVQYWPVLLRGKHELASGTPAAAA